MYCNRANQIAQSHLATYITCDNDKSKEGIPLDPPPLSDLNTLQQTLLETVHCVSPDTGASCVDFNMVSHLRSWSLMLAFQLTNWTSHAQMRTFPVYHSSLLTGRQLHLFWDSLKQMKRMLKKKKRRHRTRDIKPFGDGRTRICLRQCTGS